MNGQAIEGFQLSPQQRRLWRLLGDTPASRAQLAVQVDGELRAGLLASALTRLVRRHQILRTGFHRLPGMKVPLQVVSDDGRAAWGWCDLSGLPPAARDAEVDAVLAREAGRPLDLASGAPLRAVLLRLATDRHVLVLTLPALCADAWTLGRMVSELAELYAAAGERGEPVQYVQFSELQNELIETPDGDAYWRGRRIAGLLAARLPFERPAGGASAQPRMCTLEVGLPDGLAADAEALAAAAGVAPAIVYLAAWQVLLWRLSELPEILVGVAVDGRFYEELEDTLGLLARYLPVACRLDDGPTFSQLLVRAGEAFAAASEWQEYFDWSKIPDLGNETDPVLPFCFEIAAPSAASVTGALTFTALRQRAWIDRFKVCLSCAASEGDVLLELAWDDGVLPAAAAARLTGQLRSQLASALREPGVPIGQLDPLGADERRRLVVELNRTALPFPREATIHELIAAQAARAPEAVAAVQGDRRLTYGELAARAGRLAVRLRALGVRPGTPVGIFAERSPEMLVGILAVLEAGGAYVPLVPSYPAQRIAFMLEDTRLPVLLTQEALAGKLPPHAARLVLLDREEEEGAPSSPVPGRGAGPDDLAYLIYTSGSTGRPKGVMVTHRNLVHSTSARFAFYREPVSAFLLASPFAFDSSVAGIFWTLCQGGALVLPPESFQEDLQGLLDLFARHRVSHLLTLPSVYTLLLGQEGERRRLDSLRAVIVAGEACPAPLLGRHRERLPGTALFNEYGPTEGTVWSTVWDCAGWEPGGPVPIGRPVPNMRVYLLDVAFRPVPAGVSGELHIGGAGIARGYLGRPELTAERFLPDPFGGEPGSRLYRTGDLARFRLDGDLEFLGRADHQVKIRGYRIELEEVESALCAHPAVQEGVVVARGDGAGVEGGDRLVAYAVPRPGREPAADDLRRFLGERLPDYMVPSVFVLLDELPLTPNGKVDRKALPPPGAESRRRQAAYVAPQTPVEKALAEVWQEVLGVDRVGTHDNYFELGGDSIRSLQIVGRARERELAFTLQQLTRHPTIHELAAEIAGAGAAVAEPGPGPSLLADEDRERLPAGVEDAYPMTRLQVGMLFHGEYDPGSAVYHDVLSYHLHGTLDAERLRQALAAVIAEHPVLRTSLHLDGFSEPLQLVHRTVAVPLTAEDLRALPAEAEAAAVEVWKIAEEARRFDPRQAPLFRFHVQTRSGGTFQLHWSCHHAILDGWSAAVLLAEIFQRYGQEAGSAAAPAPPTAEYRELVALEREVVAAGEALAFWRERLAGGSFLRLPRLPGGGAAAYVPREAALPPDLSDRLKALAAALGVPLKSVLLAAHLHVLGVLGGEEDVTTGLVLNGRPERPGGERVLGLFLNTLPLRLRLPGGPWTALIREAFEREREMLPFRRYPLADLQRELGGQPLFETAFNFAHFHAVDRALQRGAIEYLEGRFLTRTNFAFGASFVLDPGTADVTLRLEYDGAEIAGAQAAVALGYYVRTLEEMVADPAACREGHLPLAAAERHQLLHEWNDTGAEEAGRPAFHELFQAQASSSPQALAARLGEERLTYGELNARANRLARHLRAAGVGPEVRVGLYLDRSLDLLVGFLAILKAGGVYLPLDPSYPEERLRFLLADSRAAVLVTREPLAGRLPAGTAARLVLLDAEAAAIAGRDAADLPGELDPRGLGYVIYTSGSTGLPKGVMVPRAGLAHLAETQRRHFHMPLDGRSLQILSLSFDGSLFEICLPLRVGAALCMGDAEEQVPGPALARLLREAAVTHAGLPPSILATLAPEDLSALRTLIVAGEACPPELAARWIPGRRFCNGYGATETAVWVIAAEATDGRAPDIGRPVVDATAHVLDRRLRPLPPGVAGELCVGGTALARGYLGRPDLTAERFLPDPFSATPGARLYRTGDLVRRRPAGDLEYLGRIDQQIKLRGLRIEPGEIEAALKAHPAVAEAVVVVRDGADGSRFLSGYVVAGPDGPVPPVELRAFLRERLPAHLVPSAFVWLERLPFTAHGKLDLRALPAPEEAAASARRAPCTALEEVLAGLWAALLGLESVGIDDDFFLAGGHSLLATQLVARVRRATGVEIPLRALFEHPTVAALAAEVERALATGAAAPAAIERLPRAGDPPLSFAQERLWFLHRLEPDSPAYHVPAALRLTGELDGAALERALAAVERRHEILRTVYAERREGPVQVIGPPRGPSLERVDLSALEAPRREAEALRLAALAARRPFDLARGPLWRVTLLRLDGREHVALLVLHHIAADGWSMGVVVREVAALYEAFAAGRPAPLPELPVQYADYALWQRRWLQGETLQAGLAWWRQRLEGASGVLELPTDRPRPPVQTWRGAGVPFRLGAGLGEALRAFDRCEGTTRFMSLLGAFQALLFRYSGQTDVIVGAPVAGRRLLETEAMIGCFVNTLALRADLGGDPSFRRLLAGVREMVLGAFAHQDVPFERIVDELQPERDVSRTPVFQVLLILQNTPMPAWELPGLTLASLDVDAGVTPFDLTLSLLETGEGIEGLLQYRTDLFEPATAARLAGHLETLLGACLAEPDRPVGELPLLGAAERRQILAAWSVNPIDFGPPMAVHRLFAAQAARTPDAVAVRGADGVLTYAEVARRAGRLARRLRELGVGSEVPVGIFLERGPDVPVALLGVLAAGGAFLPVDTVHPEERIAFLLADAGAPLVLTQERLRERLPAGGPAALALDAEVWPDGGGEPFPEIEVDPGHLAYVIYTSGSTGRPKGVMIEHRALCEALRGRQWVSPLGPEDRLLQTASLSFDISIFEQLWPLVAGACAVPYPAPVLEGPGIIAAARAHEVTVLHLATPLTRLVYESPGIETCHSVRRSFTGGEPLPAELRDRMYASLAVDVYHLYGPSEAAIEATWWLCSPKERRPISPIGRPSPNQEVYVLDTSLQPVPVGVPGEICIAGGIARGYRGRPDLTAERFVPLPWGAPGARLYRTGDRARRLPGGELEFLGRFDHQVKVRGQRVELGEIEVALAAHLGVREAMVVAREAGLGDRRLVAYLVAEPNAVLDDSELRDFAARRLPSYMVPAAFVVLPAFPLLSSGKVARRALPAPDWRSAGRERSYLAPRTPAEERLAAIWSEVLGVERVGVEDSLFDLGGHSLLATRIASRVRESFGVELPLRVLFEVPTVAGVAERLGLAAAPAPGSPPPIVPVPRTGPMPVSFAQQRLWFLDRFQPSGSTYNVPIVLRVRGALDLGVLRRTLAELVRRHETLRTTISVLAGEPVQVIHPATPPDLPRIDLSALGQPARQAAALRLATEEIAAPFDLARGPLLRVRLLELGADDRILLLTQHHVVTDGWSGRVLTGELGLLYQALAAGAPSPLPELPVQYADFAVWQRTWQFPVIEEQLRYWRQRLAGMPPGLDLPADRPRPLVQTSRGGRAVWTAPPGLADGLAALGRRQGTTLFMTLLAAFDVLLCRYTAQEDLAVGSPIAGRTRTETEGLIGFFVNMLVLRADLTGDPAFTEVLRRARETTLEAYGCQEVPFEMLVEALQPRRDLARTPLFQVVLVLQSATAQPVAIPGLELTPVELEGDAAEFDLVVSLAETGRGLEGWLKYNRDLFDATTMRRLAGHLESLLAAAIADPRQRLSELPLLTAAESQQLREWSSAPPLRVAPRCLHELFEAQADRTPEAVAAELDGEALSYLELDRRASRLAHALRAAGIGPESLVGICLERCLEMVVALLGVLKAGGAYVPLDPSYPRERLAYMLADSAAAVVLTREADQEALPDLPVRRLLLDREDLSSYPDARPRNRTFPGGAAYVLYTSGSTGRPKGAVITHESLVHQISWLISALGLTPADRMLQKTPFSFDASVWELCAPLLAGGRVVLARPGEHQYPDLLLAAVQRHEITVLQLVPSLLGALLNEPGLGDCQSLRWISCGGETLAAELVDRLRARLDVNLMNLYGPTECTIQVSWWPCLPSEERRAVTIGRPMPDIQIHLLDPWLRPVPAGVPGELCIGGAQVGRGYLGRPDLTAERFLPDPFAGSPGARLYRTGDLARLMPGGEIEFLHRIDSQFKVRGFRIELGEIEASLLQRTEIAAAVAMVREDAPGDQRLVAYLVPAPGLDPGEVEDIPAAARRSLDERLPTYMVPAAFVLLEAMPLLPNGKLDRRALPPPDWETGPGARRRRPRRKRQADYLEPRNAVEQQLAGLFAEVLRVERVGVESSFFELGGHSLLATQLVSRIRTAFGAELPLRKVFESPTVAALGAEIEAGRGAALRLEVPPLTPAPRRGDLPLSFAQERLWFLDQLEPGSPAYNIPAVLRLAGALSVPALAAALGEIARRHEVLRTRFEVVDGRPRQVVDPWTGVPLPVLDLTRLSAAARRAELARLLAAEGVRPFDLAREPVLRAALFRLGAEEHVLSLGVHHIAADGWSTGIFVRELAVLYEAGFAGVPSPLLELPVQYADFAVWQRSWLRGEALEAHLTYWRERLSGRLTPMRLPAERPAVDPPAHRGEVMELALPEDLAGSLRRLSLQEGTTPFMTLLAAWMVLLHRYTDEREVIVGSPIANRNRQETEGLIGFFVNMLALAGDLTGEPPFTVFLAQVRETTLGAYAHQDLPFEQLVEQLPPERDLARNPLFEITFAVQNVPRAEARLATLAIESLEPEALAVRFDLEVDFGEGPGGDLRGRFLYEADRFDRSTIVLLAGRFATLLAGIAADPATPAGELPLMSAAERQQALVEWSGTPPLPAADPVALLEAQARATPDAVAVVSAEGKTTYGELHRHAARLARRLRRLGVGPEVLVGVLAERSADLLVALLGVLKAGGAYLPLDPATPRERLAFLLDDAGARLVVTQERLADRLPDRPEVRRLLLGSGREDLEAASTGPLAAPALPAHPAYVIYTSGSTGQPKGVVVPRSALAAYMQDAARAYELAATDRALQFAAASFDASAEEIYPTLARGAVLVLRDEAMLGSPAGFLAAVGALGITVLNLPTAYWHTLAGALAAEGLELPGCLRLVILGGERALPGAFAAWSRRAAPGLRIVNTYGPTEATIVATRWEPGARPPEHDVPIGRAIRGVRTYLVDPSLRPVPPGVAGELCLGGSGLARGYLGRPDLTAEPFVPDPFSGEPGARLYRTGDLARFLPDGDLQYLGRTDLQVKVRGFRVEPQEIESVLAAHPSVRESVVVAREEAGGGLRLVAYVVPVSGSAEEGLWADLRRHLAASLPDYMVPAALVTLAALPLLPSGKVDRRHLPAPDWGAQRGGAYVAPRTPVEELVAGLFSTVLGVEGIGAQDGFFDLGGHSLLATQLVSRLRSAFGVEVPLRRVFESPTVAGLAAAVEALRAAGLGLEAPPIRPAPRQGGLPLSFAQQRLWFLDQLTPGGVAYNIPSAFRLQGRLPVTVFARVLEEIAYRHEVLRTTFDSVEGEPVQVVHPHFVADLPVVDLGSLPAELRPAIARELAAAAARRPFDLARGPLLRVHLVRLAPDDHLMLLMMHHIISDGWSTGLFLTEVGALFAAFSQGLPSPLPPLALQYADYAAWQRDWLQGEELASRLEHWRRELAGAEPLRLPTDRRRSALGDHRSGVVELEVSAELTGSLKALSLRSGATLFMTMLAAWMTLFRRYTGQRDILLGSPIANRNREEIENLIGFFVNLLVLRGDLSGDPDFSTLLGRVRETVLGAYAHQDVPFELLVQELQPERDLASTPLFQVLLAFQNAPLRPLELPGLRMEPVETDGGAAKFDLTVTLAESEGRLSGQIEHDRSLFDAATIERMAGHLLELLAGVAADPARPLSRLPLLSAAERGQLLAWNAAVAEEGEPPTLTVLWEAQAARSPEAPAVSCDGRTVSYGELNRQANRLGRRLRRLGVGPESKVGVLLDRSPELVAALLGVLKAGGAYVPLDPSLPAERLAYFCADSGMEALVTDGRLELPPVRHVVRLGEEAGEDAGDPEARAAAGNLCYVIYTSGSTGRPKGVQVTHGNVARLLSSTERWFDFGPHDTWTLFHSYSFDFSVWELWGALAYGGRLVVVPYWVSRSPEAFHRLLVKEGVTVLNQTPSAFKALVQADGEAPAGERERLSLRLVIFGGEALDLASLRPWYARHALDAPRLVNMYGITETTVHVSYRPVSPEDLSESHRSPIGGAIPDLSLRVVDRELELVPVGVAGEICVGGAGLARGYLGRPELTAERFVPDPFVAEPGERLYRSGDLARYRADGELEYLGRIDLQVKVRGFRIELGEIEAALLRDSRVQAAVAVVREDRAGDPRIAAYVAPVAPSEDLVPALERSLRQTLPDFMIPSSITVLSDLPRLASGKVDRRALPVPDGVPRTGGSRAPRDLLELQLVQLWEEVLGRHPVGVNEDFFALGGHSLLAMHLISRIERLRGRRLPVAALFEGATVERIAGLLRAESPGETLCSLVPLQPRGSGLPLFWVHGAGGAVFSYLELARRLGTERPFYGLQAPGLDGGPESPETTLKALAARYLEEVRAVQPEGPYHLGGWSMGGVIAFEMAQQFQAQGQRVGLLALLDSWVPRRPAKVARDAELGLLGAFVRHLGLEVADPAGAAKQLRRLPSDERLARVLAELRRAALLPADFDLPRLRRLFDVFKAGVAALESYEPRLYPGRVTLFKAEESTGPETLGWDRLAAGGLEVLPVPGDHFSLLREPHAEVLARLIRGKLDEGNGGSPVPLLPDEEVGWNASRSAS